MNIKEAKYFLVRDFGFQSSKIKILEYSQVGDAINFSVCNTNYSWKKSRGLKEGYRNPTGFRRWVKVAGSGGLCYTCVMGTWKSKNRHKYLLQYHIIFVCKYRKKLLMSKQISDDIKQFSYEICQKHKVIIRYMETDKDHIHYMIETEPTMSISKIVNLMKSYTTYHIWKRYPDYLRKHFWKEHTFWTDGYFVCSVGNVSEEMLRKYIENQG